MNCGFLDSGGMKNNNRKKTNTVPGSITESDGILNDTTPLESAAKEVVSPFVVDETVKTTTAGNTSDKSSYANVTGEPSGSKVNFHTLFTLGCNGIDVVVMVECIRAISERFANYAYGFFLEKRVAYLVVANYVKNTWGKYGLVRSMFSSSTSEDGLSAIAIKLGTPIMLDSYTSDMCMQSWGRSSYARAMIELRANVELKDIIVVAMPKITREGYYTRAGETKNLKKTSQTPKGIPVGHKVGFKTTKQVYQHVFKKSTTNSSGNIKKNIEPTKEVSKSNPFENVDSSSPSTILIIKKIDKLIIDEKVTLADDEEKPLKKVISSGDYDSEDEVPSVDNEMASFLAKEDGYGTQTLLEQWKESYENDDNEYDPYDDDMYEGQKILDKLQAITWIL
uniref:Zinc finger, CCHC-type n=1 Tax=Tanacetum cinerariifolium TaxID=118510 RepID=A0A6L2LKJ2_TANCI|nr:hypothetical protein [Tanacetum cinerariifolium]